MARTRFDPNRVFNPLPERRIHRKRIGIAERVVSGVILAVLAGAGAWVLAQKNAFDPTERDISTAQLAAGGPARELYKAPLKRWSESEKAGTGTGTVVAAAGPDLGFFPREVLDGGWTLSGRVELFNPDNLYEKIDGGAEQYLALGFRRLYYATLEKGGTFITLEVYDQTDVPNTLGIFAAQRDPQQKVERSGSAYFYRTSVGALGIVGNHYFKLNGSVESPEVRAKTDALIPLFAALPSSAPKGGSRVLDALMTGLAVPFEAVSFEKSNVFAYDFLGDTWFARSGQGDARWFVHDAKSEAEAGALAAKLAGEQENEYAVVDAKGARRLYRHKALGSFFALDTRGATLFGVDAAPDRATAERMLDRLAAALNH